MNGLAWALGCWLLSALGALVLRRIPGAARLALAGALLGSSAALYTAARLLASAQTYLWSLSWTLPGGALALRLDPLSAVFLLPIGTLGGLCAIFGWQYLQGHDGVQARALSLGLFNVLLASMALVVAANDLLLLLIAWEVMTLSSWALVVSDHHEPSARAAGLLYLAAAHVATAALIIFVLSLSAGGSFRIDALHIQSAARDALFLLALIGFGTKAGVFPLHVWLPDAHPAAPSHVSALMSAVMITMGFYGLARFLPLIGPPALWWGSLLITLGVAGALSGILSALAQRDVKRVLAYSTVENAGIITVAFGVALLGAALGRPVLAGIGWTAGLLHIWNHALAKGALFLGLGAVAQAVGSRQLDALGGVLRRVPLLSALLIALAAAMAALPGLNLFTSEWLLMAGLISDATRLDGITQVLLLVPFIALSLAGALALACFARLVGVGLLGHARTPESARFALSAWQLRTPVLLLTLGCAAVALWPAQTAHMLSAAVRIIEPTAANLGGLNASLRILGWILPALLAGTALVLAARRLLKAQLVAARSSTWACGYSEPTAAMQYTSTSFSEPLLRVMQPVLATDTELLVEGNSGSNVWPVRMTWSSRNADRVLTGVYLRALTFIDRASLRIRLFQKPRVTTALLYIVLVVVLLLALLFLPGVGA